MIWGLVVVQLHAAERVRRGVEFAKVGEIPLCLDLYRPSVAEGSFPLVVWVHGGAWRSGSRVEVPIKEMVGRGYAVASVDYRLTPVAPFPANVHDIKAAIRFLRANAEDFGIDAGRIYIAGASAGGHLAALVGLTNGSKGHEGTVGSELKTSSDVQAVVSFFGASDLLTILDQSTAHGLGVRVPALQLLLGGSPQEKPALARLASPVHQLDRSDPPVLLIHGNKDPQMPVEQSQELHRALVALGKVCELVIVEGGVHGGKGFFEAAMLERVHCFLGEVVE